MNTLLPLTPPTGQKNSPAVNSSKPNSLKKQIQDTEPFESKLKASTDKSQESQNKEDTEVKVEENTTDEVPVDTDNAEASTPIALFPNQIIIQEQVQNGTEENNSLGSIFSKPENNSEINLKIDQNIENSSKEKNIFGKKLLSTPELPVFDFISTAAIHENSEESLKSPTVKLESKVLELIKQSVAEQPIPATDLDPTLQRPLHLDLPQSSLKELVVTSKNESVHLSSQHHLDKVLESTFEENPLPTPRRIEVKLETPQGSQVTLYIARVNQELRAQFSANNVLAFQWLQKEISQLKSLQTGEYVRWLPAQIDASITKTQSSSSKSSQEDLKRDRDKENSTPIESLFDFFKPSTRRIA